MHGSPRYIMPATPYTPPEFEAEHACSGLQFGEYTHDSPRWNMPKTPYTPLDFEAECDVRMFRSASR